jgi:hypothetical protein
MILYRALECFLTSKEKNQKLWRLRGKLGTRSGYRKRLKTNRGELVTKSRLKEKREVNYLLKAQL